MWIEGYTRGSCYEAFYPGMFSHSLFLLRFSAVAKHIRFHLFNHLRKLRPIIRDPRWENRPTLYSSARSRGDAFFASAGRRQTDNSRNTIARFDARSCVRGPRKANETTSIRCKTKRIFTTFAENRYLYAIGNDLTSESAQRCDRHNTDMAVARPSVRPPRAAAATHTADGRFAVTSDPAAGFYRLRNLTSS